MREVVVAGVGMTRFARQPDVSVAQHGTNATLRALDDAGIAWQEVQEVFCGASAVGPYVGNQIGHQLGLTGVPIVNVENASASGSSAFRQAYLAVAEGRSDVALAVGTGKLGANMTESVMSDDMVLRRNLGQAFFNAMSIFALKAKRRMEEFGTEPEVFARIAVKSHNYGARNPYAYHQYETDLDKVLGSRMIADPLTVQQCCPMGDGGAAAMLTTREHAEKIGRHVPITVAASVMKGEIYADHYFPEGVLTEATAKEAYEQCGLGPEDFDLVQVHDATSSEELEYYESLGLCAAGEAEAMVMRGDMGPGGKTPVNTDGGLVSRGHPLGPTGLAQIWETVQQLRGEAGGRQVPDAKVGLIQMIGAGFVCFVHVLKR